MNLEPVVYLFSHKQASTDKSSTGLTERLGSTPRARVVSKSSPKVNSDPCLLLLLADQELVDGREEQARYLVEAAYDVFDRKANGNVYRLHLAS